LFYPWSFETISNQLAFAQQETIMIMKKVLAGWSKICPGCSIGRKYPDSFIGKKVRNHWQKGCISHSAYVELYGSDTPPPEKNSEKSDAE
jgi:hypothetical protein